MFLDPPGNFPLYGDYKKMMAERVDGRRQYRTIGQILVSCPPPGGGGSILDLIFRRIHQIAGSIRLRVLLISTPRAGSLYGNLGR